MLHPEPSTAATRAFKREIRFPLLAEKRFRLECVFIELLLDRLTIEQIASAVEQFELICEQRG